MIIEVPKTDLISAGDHEFVIFVVQLDTLCISLELEQKLFGYKIVLVDQAIHCDQEEVPVWLRTHRNVGNLRICVSKGQLVVVDFDSLETLTFYSYERAGRLQIFHL